MSDELPSPQGVRSARGTQFRHWATERLSEYLVKGFTMDDERLKNPPVDDKGIPDYFDELLERIRDIRTSERRVYLRAREIFARAADYQASEKRPLPSSKQSRTSSTSPPPTSLPPNSSKNGPMQVYQTWVSRPGMAKPCARPM